MKYLAGVSTLACINCIAVLGLAVFTGFTGLFSLGHAAFMAIGAYTAALLTFLYGVPFVPAVLAGSIAAGAISLLIGVPTLKARLRSDYLAITIMGFGEAVRVILENLPITQGARGLPGIAPYTKLPIALAFLAVCTLLARNFVLSKYGWRCIAAREDPVAAEMMGVDLFKTRLLSLMTSAAMAGVSGGLLAHYLTFIQPVMFTSTQSTQITASVVAGGMGSITGPILASVIFTVFPEFLRMAKIWRLVLYGFLLIVIIVFRPQGILGYRDLSWSVVDGLSRRKRGREAIKDA